MQTFTFVIFTFTPIPLASLGVFPLGKEGQGTSVYEGGVIQPISILIQLVTHLYTLEVIPVYTVCCLPLYDELRLLVIFFVEVDSYLENVGVVSEYVMLPGQSG